MRKFALTAMPLSFLAALTACGGGSASDSDGSNEAMAEADAQVTFAELSGDASAGETVFTRCRACHMIEPGKNGVGPTLYGVVGRKAGTADGFAYSEANASADITWTSDVLFEYLESPRDYLPGSRMAFPGIGDAQERADLIAYLETQG